MNPTALPWLPPLQRLPTLLALLGLLTSPVPPLASPAAGQTTAGPMAGEATGETARFAPAALDDGWAVGDAAAAGLDVARLDALVDSIDAGTFPRLHGLVVARDGELVAELYRPGHAFEYEGEAFLGQLTDFDATTSHHIASVTKSVTGLVVGIAIDDGCVPGTDALVFPYFPEYSDHAGGAKDSITVGHLLTMTSGLRWDEQSMSYGDAENDIIRMFTTDDPVEYVLAKPLAAPPATSWTYNGGGSTVLGEVVRRGCGATVEALAQARLFDPLGIGTVEWDRFDDGTLYASGGLALTPRALAKLGQLVLDGGSWNGRQVVSGEWVEAMTSPIVPLGRENAYGLHWWNRYYRNGSTTTRAIMATGWGGQRILVFPALELVVVTTGESYTQPDGLDGLVARFILPAVMGSGWSG